MRITLALATCLALAGCSDEPSEAEMRAAVEAHAKAELAKAGRPFEAFSAFRKQGCVEDKETEGERDCYYVATVPASSALAGKAVNGKGQFRRTDKGWSFKDLGAQPK